MDLETIRQGVENHPEGVRIIMIDGTRYDVPHRDFIALGPGIDAGLSPRRAASRTTFTLHEVGGVPLQLINAMLVKEVVPLPRNGGAQRRKKSA
jgi:hypothetical protein